MGYTKRAIVNKAFGKIGLASYAFDLEPEQLQAALSDLDMMMASWNNKGVRLGYPLPASHGDSDLDTETGVPDSALEAMVTNLAIRIAGDFGRAVSPETKMIARSTYKALISKSAISNVRQLNTHVIPSGAGNMRYGGYDGRPRRLIEATDELTAGPDGPLEWG